MVAKKQKSFNSQVYDLACKRLKLKRREKIIFYRLLGFLIRNDKPFPYSSNAMAELTGYARSSVFESINLLEKYRLIERVGFTSRVKFIKGSILKRICTLVQNRYLYVQDKNDTLVQKSDKIISTSPETGYNKTSFLLKLKEGDFLVSEKATREDIQNIKWYLERPNQIMSDKLKQLLL